MSKGMDDPRNNRNDDRLRSIRLQTKTSNKIMKNRDNRQNGRSITKVYSCVISIARNFDVGGSPPRCERYPTNVTPLLNYPIYAIQGEYKSSGEKEHI